MGNNNTNKENTNPKNDSMVSKFKKNREVVQNELQDLSKSNTNVSVDTVNNDDKVSNVENNSVDIPLPKKKKKNTEKYLLALTETQKNTLDRLSYTKSSSISVLIKEAIKSHYNLTDEEF